MAVRCFQMLPGASGCTIDLPLMFTLILCLVTVSNIFFSFLFIQLYPRIIIGHKFCGPSRAALQSGRLPIHVTVLDNPLDSVNPKDPISGFQGIPRNMTGLATKMKQAGYSTHAYGLVFSSSNQLLVMKFISNLTVLFSPHFLLSQKMALWSCHARSYAKGPRL